MAFTLEEIAADAKACADDVWWQAHDEKDYVAASLNFLTAENVISKYSGNQVEHYDALKYFSLALQNYDKFTEKLKGGNGTSGLEDNIMSKLVGVYNALNLNPSIAQCNANWWIYFARMKIADARSSITESDRYFAMMTQNIIDEHALRFPKLSKSEARGLASLLVSAGMLGHGEKDWKKSHELLNVYYKELLTTLASKQ